MHVQILHSGLLSKIDSYCRHEFFDAGRYTFTVVGESRWGRDHYLMQGGHGDPNSPDLLIAHSSMFQFDLLRMLRFILATRKRAPWIVYVLLLSEEEANEVATLPTAICDHFSRYFQIASAQFSIETIHEYVKSNIQLLENLVLNKRRQHFATEIISREHLDRSIQDNKDEPEYDFAISFSGAQRAQARDLANALNGRGCNVFFDEFETTSIVGKNLVEELYAVYNSKSRYCVILVSPEYKNGPWTNQERRAALDKAISDSDGTYILPIKISDTKLPGLSTSASYLTWDSNPSHLASILYEKLVLDMIAIPSQRTA